MVSNVWMLLKVKEVVGKFGVETSGRSKDRDVVRGGAVGLAMGSTKGCEGSCGHSSELSSELTRGP